MEIALVFLIIMFVAFVLYQIYLKDYFNVIKSFKILRKALDTRDILLLKIIPDVNDKNLSAETLKLIEDRNEESKISYNDAIQSDIKLHNTLKKVYEEIDRIKKNQLQIEIFKRIISLEKSIKKLRQEYCNKVNLYNIGLTMHVNVLIKMLHLKPLDTYKEE